MECFSHLALALLGNCLQVLGNCLQSDELIAKLLSDEDKREMEELALGKVAKCYRLLAVPLICTFHSVLVFWHLWHHAKSHQHHFTIF